MNQTTKATHDAYNTELFAPVMKQTTGKYIAVLSDTSIDRDDERVGKTALEKVQRNFGYVAGLIDHENKVLNQVCEWTNVQVTEIDGHSALVAEPKFFVSNPNAKIIKGMLDEGAQIGISIGAIVKEYKDDKINGKVMRTFTDLELLEASFVAIPSNRHGRVVAVAKSFSNEKKKGIKMSEDINYTQKDIDFAVSEKSKGFESQVSDLNKQLVSKDSKISDLEKTLVEKDSAVKEVEKTLESTNTKLAETEKALEIEKKAVIEKQQFADKGGDEEQEVTDEEVDKSFKKGMLPIMKI
jgi:vacuolar-type H+-ATPase subunit I/STV1